MGCHTTFIRKRPKMRYRFAKSRDLHSLVNLHYAVREHYSVGIFSKFDKNLLRCYYKILLKDINSLIICAEHKDGRLVGFCSANLNVEEQLKILKKNKFRIMFSALSSIISQPSLIFQLLTRYRSIDSGDQFISKYGARLEFWLWSKESSDITSSLYMHESLLNILECLGVQEVGFEVDVSNSKVLKFHKLNGASIEKKIILKDQRERAFMKYNFSNRVTKIKLKK